MSLVGEGQRCRPGEKLIQTLDEIPISDFGGVDVGLPELRPGGGEDGRGGAGWLSRRAGLLIPSGSLAQHSG